MKNKAKKPIKILMIPSWYPNKDSKDYFIGIFHYEQAVDLLKYCEVAMYYPFDGSLVEETTQEVERGILTYRSKFIRSQRIKNRIRILKTFNQIRKEFQPDIIHAHVAIDAGKYSAFLGKLFKIPVVITEHSSVEVAISGKVGYYISKYVYKRCAYNACCSDDLQQKLKGIFPNIPFYVVYNGTQAVTERLNEVNHYYKQGYVNLVIVGAFYSLEIKGYQFLLPAIKQLREDGYSVILHIIGDGEHKAHYVKLSEELGIKEECIFYGACNRDRVYDIVREMDFFVSASLVECSGVSVQEAMLLGKPIVVTKSGGANSLVTAETAIIVEKGSTQSLVDGIKKMILERNTFDSEKIKAYAQEKFEIGNISKQYMRIYRTVLDNRKYNRENKDATQN